MSSMTLCIMLTTDKVIMRLQIQIQNPSYAHARVSAVRQGPDMNWICWYRAADEFEFLSQDARTKHLAGQQRLQAYLFDIISDMSGCGTVAPACISEDSISPVNLPICNVLITNGAFQQIDLRGFIQGSQVLCSTSDLACWVRCKFKLSCHFKLYCSCHYSLEDFLTF